MRYVIYVLIGIGILQAVEIHPKISVKPVYFLDKFFFVSAWPAFASYAGSVYFINQFETSNDPNKL